MNRRLYAMDALRAVMMLLGVVIHTTVTYAPYESPVRTIMARQTSDVFFYIVSFIHSFRMPVFFLVAGYFGALLYYRKGAREMLMNRITRVLLPMIVGVLVLYPAVYFTFKFSSFRIAGESDAWLKAVRIMKDGAFLPYRLSHLWFLYGLLIFSVATVLPAAILKRSGLSFEWLSAMASRMFASPLARITLVALAYYAGLLLNKEYTLHTNVSFWIDRKLFYCYFLFYGFGWLTYYCNVLDALKWKPILQLALGLAMFTISMTLEFQTEGEQRLRIMQVTNALATTFFTLGFTSLFLNRFNEYNRGFAYIMDAAYYIYLIHVPFAIIIPGLLTNLGLPLALEFLVTFSVTLAISFGTYHYFVRGRLIGKFLDGSLFRKKHHPAVSIPAQG